MKKWLRFLLAASLVFSALASTSTAQAAIGDTDTYFNLESNTSSSHRYAIGAPNNAAHLTNGFTWEIWLRPTNLCSGIYCHVFAKENEYVLGVVNGTYQFALNGTSGGWVWVDTSIAVKLNAWQHVAFTRAASTNLVTMYLNGKPVYTNVAGHLGTGNFADTSYNFQIGARTSNVSNANATAAQSYIGSLDELKFWKTARSQSEIQSDMSSYGPTNDSNLQLYYDFNDVSGNTLENKANGATSSSTLTLMNSPTISNLVSTTTSSGNSVVRFPRTYLSANGYRLPTGISSLSLLVVGGGGGGGSNVGNGGSGGGGYSIANYSVNSSSTLSLKVGTGGVGGRSTAAGTLTYDGTFRIDGQDGETSTVTIDSTSFVGGGGGGGQTIWTNNFCLGSGELFTSSVSGAGSGSGGTSLTGGLGGVRSSTQSVANGAAGFTSNISGTSTNYSGGGGAGGWSGRVTGNGANSIGGDGSGANGVDGTGSGGGGNAASCAAGGHGGNGIIILSYSAYTGELSLPASPVFRTSSSIVATVSTPGVVAFFEKGKIISTCKKVTTVSASSITATCLWKPRSQGVTFISARFTATDGGSFPASLRASQVTVVKRTTPR